LHDPAPAALYTLSLHAALPILRARAKTINFATIYGQGAHALSRQLKIANAEARAFIDTYFERFHGVKAYLDSRIELARDKGYAEDRKSTRLNSSHVKISYAVFC